MSEKPKQVELKLYYSDIEYVVDFIKSQDPFMKIFSDFQDLKESRDLGEFIKAYEKFLKSWDITAQHINNILLLCESYLETKEYEHEDKIQDK